MTTQITLQQLAEKINGKYWEKGDLKRIYLDRGYNTKKMTTKTFIWQDESGDFRVSCKVECYSQPWQWCKSQEDEIKAGVTSEIENALSETVYLFVNPDGEYISEWGKVMPLNDVHDYYFTQREAEKVLENFPKGTTIKEMPRDMYHDECARMDELQSKS